MRSAPGFRPRGTARRGRREPASRRPSRARQCPGTMLTARAVDVIVAGGGIAGASVAAALRESGQEVLVVEPGLDRTKRLSGELVHPPGVTDLATLGLREHLPPGSIVPVQGFAVLPEGGSGPYLLRYGEIPGLAAHGFAIDHADLAAGLAAALARFPHVRVESGRASPAWTFTTRTSPPSPSPGTAGRPRSGRGCSSRPTGRAPRPERWRASATSGPGSPAWPGIFCGASRPRIRASPACSWAAPRPRSPTRSATARCGSCSTCRRTSTASRRPAGTRRTAGHFPSRSAAR